MPNYLYAGFILSTQKLITSQKAKTKNTGVSMPRIKFTKGQNCQNQFYSPHNLNNVVGLEIQSYLILL